MIACWWRCYTNWVPCHSCGPTYRRHSWFAQCRRTHGPCTNPTLVFFQWGETHNHIFGRTTNPFRRYMTPGGSSGGEGALLAMRGSPLGVGTDIGGYVSPALIITNSRANRCCPPTAKPLHYNHTARSASPVCSAGFTHCARAMSVFHTRGHSMRRKDKSPFRPSWALWRLRCLV